MAEHQVTIDSSWLLVAGRPEGWIRVRCTCGWSAEFTSERDGINPASGYEIAEQHLTVTPPE